MIYAIQGKLIRVAPHQIWIQVGGFVFWLRVPLSVSQTLSHQSEALLYTLLHLPREEGEPVLYGFLGEEERRLFIQLLRVRNLGPQKALALISHFPTELLVQVIRAGDVSALTSVKGIGKKLAQQLILDMQPALQHFASHSLSPQYAEAYEALVTLGLTPQEAHTRLQAALKEEPEAPAEKLVQLALKSS
ncbi:MAG: Holliday junction branch migration protein RuvA [Bacteroidia bacterium]|nr:Holliday junction branch migration protein RuvA [Bacteroidia bacterium]